LAALCSPGAACLPRGGRLVGRARRVRVVLMGRSFISAGSKAARGARILLALAGLLAAMSSAIASGCAVDCHKTLTCGDAPLGAGGAGGGAPSGSGGSGGGGDIGPCVPSEADGPVDPRCGV